MARDDGRLQLWDPKTGDVETRAAHTGQVFEVAFAPDGRLFASMGADGRIEIWDLTGRQPLRTLRVPGMATTGAAWSEDGRELVTMSRDQTLRLWDAESGESRRVIALPSTTGWRVALRPGKRQVVTTHRDGTARLWDLETGAPIRTFQGPDALVWAVAFSRDGRQLFTGSSEKTIRSWDVETGAPLAVLRGDYQDVLDVQLGPDGHTLASASYAPAGHTMHLWNARSIATSVRGEDTLGAGVASNVVLAPDRSTALFADLVGDVWRLELPSGVARKLDGITNARLLAVGPDSSVLATAGSDAVVRLWDVETGRLRDLLGGHQNEIQALRFSADGALLASAGADYAVRLWDVHEGRLARALRGHTNRVADVAFSSDGRRLASASNDMTVRIWQVSDGAEVQRIALSSGLNAIRFGGNDDFVVAGTWGGDVVRIDLASQKQPTLASCEGATLALDAAADGLRFAVGCSGPGLIVDANGGAVGPLGFAGRAAVPLFHPDGLLTLETDLAVRLRDLKSGRPAWKAPVMLDDPPRLFTHRGWQSLDGSTGEPPGPSAWRDAVETSALKGSQSPDRRALCLLTSDGSLERWDLAADRRAFSQPASEKGTVLALDRGCAILDPGGQLAVVDERGGRACLIAEVSAMARDRGGVLAATGRRLIRCDVGGAEQVVATAAANGTAVARVDGVFAVGYADGTIRLVPATGGAAVAGLTFEPPPPALASGHAVVGLMPGPMETLVAAYDSGLVGAWDTRQGELLRYVLLHGSPVHLVLSGQKVYAASDIGVHAVLDLRVFSQDRCTLLREVWGEVPAVWVDGRPVPEAPPAGHPCATH